MTYWQQAGQQAVRRSTYLEALHHFTAALELLTSLPDSPERTQQELALHLALSVPLVATKGYAAPEVEHAYARARELCQHMGDTPQLFPVLRGLAEFYIVRGELQTACTLGEQLLSQAQSVQHPTLLLGAHTVLGVTLFYIGEFASSRTHLAQGMAHYDPQQHRAHASRTAQDPGVLCLTTASWALWGLGYPDQALEHIHEALALAGRLAHPHSLVRAGKSGQPDEGLATLAEALTASQSTGERFYEAELHRLQGELLLQAAVRGLASDVSTPDAAAEACFQRALAVARRQQAKSLELRAAMSLGRLWQHQGKRAAARQLLEEI